MATRPNLPSSTSSRTSPTIRTDRRTATRKRRVPRAQYPLGIERDYYLAIKAEVGHLFAAIEKAIAGHAAAMVERYAAARARKDDVHADALHDDLERLFRPLLIRWGHRSQQLRALVQRFASQAERWNLVQFQRQVRAVAGIDLVAREPWLTEELALFTRENVALVKDIGDTAIARVERVVTEGVRKGESTKAITQAIQDEMGIAERRAKLIAVDQIGKFNGKLSQLRQADAGIDSYTWRTCKDARVRPAHRSREGRVYRWDAPPSDGHPGEPIRCRCHAEPVLDMFADLLPDDEPTNWEAIGKPPRRIGR